MTNGLSTVLERKSCAGCNSLNISYELTYPDGSKDVFEYCVNGANDPNRKFFLKKRYDPFGNYLQYNYSGNVTAIKLDTIVHQDDTANQFHRLQFTYGTGVTISRIDLKLGAQVRSVQFGYASDGKLSKITDPIGIASEFVYGPGDFINSLTTPYGTTKFSKEPDKGALDDRWLTATDPLGQIEAIAYILQIPTDAVPDGKRPVLTVPGGVNGGLLEFRNTFFWDKKAIQAAGGFSQAKPDYGKARILHWLHSNSTWNPVGNVAAGVLESEKMPLESRVWYRYPGQTDSTSLPANLDTGIGLPSVVARLLSDDKTTRLHQFEYNDFGQVTKYTDPKGRETTFIYEANGIDLSEIRQTTGGANYFLGKLEYYNSQDPDYPALGGKHLVKNMFDASGQRTLYKYNTSGQVTDIQNAKNELTKFYYNTTSGFLEKVIFPAVTGVADAQNQWLFTPTAFFKIGTFTDQDGYAVTMAYDALDRVTSITYPDAQTVQVVYDKLRPVLFKDRAGMWSAAGYNALGQLVAIRDAADRVTQFEWCSCGSLSSVTDPLGRSTFWERDLQGRVTRKTLQDGTAYTYSYDTAVNRVLQTTDPKAQTTIAGYDIDDNLSSISYSGALVPTPAVSFAYDSVFNRLSSYTDGNGQTTLSYNPFATSLPSPAALGKGVLSGIDGPFDRDRVDVGDRDELGRLKSRLNYLTGSEGYTYDPLGRIGTLSRLQPLNGSPLSSVITYDQGADRPLQVSFPDNRISAFAYYSPSDTPNGSQNQQLLKTIHHRNAASSTISKFDYNYDTLWNVLTQTRQKDGNPTDFYTYGYDRVNQMMAADLTNGSPSSPQTTWVKRSFYSYDPAGNRTSEHIETPSAAVASSVYSNNPLNQLTRRYAGERIVVQGPITDNALKSVTINGREAPVSGTAPNWTFSGYAVVSTEARTFTVTAKDSTGNTRTENFEITGNVSATGTGKELYYDLDGNLTTCIEGTSKTTFEWDAADRMIAIERVSNGARVGRSEFSYDAFGRRVRIVEKNGGGDTVSDTRYVWLGAQIVCSMNAAGTSVIRVYYADGFSDNGQHYYYTRDHLGSVREVIDSTGTIRARYDYDAYGRITKLSGDIDSDFGFTGYFWHGPSGMWLAAYRAYDPDIGRWLSRDPIAEAAGLNLYNYVGGNPVNHIDPLGLWDAVMITDRSVGTDYFMWSLNEPLTYMKSGISDWEDLIQNLEKQQRKEGANHFLLIFA